MQMQLWQAMQALLRFMFIFVRNLELEWCELAAALRQGIVVLSPLQAEVSVLGLPRHATGGSTWAGLRSDPRPAAWGLCAGPAPAGF